MVTKHRITINLDDEDFEALTQLSKTADRPLSYLGRIAVRRLVVEELGPKNTVPTSAPSAQPSVAK